ncbi:MAG: hypothetical protein AAFX06_02650 [Planctomycetota bacterium]
MSARWMIYVMVVTTALGLAGFPRDVFAQSETDEPPSQDATDSERVEIPVEVLSDEKLERLLNVRLSGEMGYNFGQFANMFFVQSRIRVGMGLGLMTEDGEVAERPLQSPFPPTYKPTLREFLDSIAMQTFSDWSYDPKRQFISGPKEMLAEDPNKRVDKIAIFGFTKRKEKREKNFEIKLAEGWKTIDQGNWVMHVPTSFPVGMDIYDLGMFSSDEEVDEKEFRDSIREQVSLGWANQISPGVEAKDLATKDVGEHEAKYFETLIPSRLGKQVRWRQWVFTVKNRCFFIVSTLPPELDKTVLPDVEAMVQSIKIRSTP